MTARDPVAATRRPPRRHRNRGTLALLGVLILAGLIGGTALGVWQIQRRAWKLDLIDRVETRVHQPATPAPGPDAWPTISRNGDEYRHVRVTGRFLDDHETPRTCHDRPWQRLLGHDAALQANAASPCSSIAASFRPIARIRQAGQKGGRSTIRSPFGDCCASASPRAISCAPMSRKSSAGIPATCGRSQRRKV